MGMVDGRSIRVAGHKEGIAIPARGGLARRYGSWAAVPVGEPILLRTSGDGLLAGVNKHSRL